MCVTGFVFRFFQYSAWCAPAHGACIHPPYMQAPTLFDKEGNMSTVASPGFKTVGEHLADGVLPTARQSLALLQACSQSATVNVCLYAYSQDNPCFVLIIIFVFCYASVEVCYVCRAAALTPRGQFRHRPGHVRRNTPPQPAQQQRVRP